MLCSNFGLNPCPASPQQGKSLGGKKGQGEEKKKKRKKKLGAAPFMKSRGMMKMTCMVFLRPEMEGWWMCPGSSPHIPDSVSLGVVWLWLV
jgi:hypothetical protein